METRRETRSAASGAVPCAPRWPGAARAAALAAALCAALLVACLAALAGPPTATAVEPTVFTVERVDKVTTIQDLQRASREARNEMANLKTRLDDLSRSYADARGRLDAINRDLTVARHDLGRAELALETQRKIVGERLVAMYKTGETTMLDILVGFSGFSELQSGLSLMRRIAESDQAEQEKLERLTESTEKLTAALDEQREAALVVEQEIDEQRVQLALTLDARRTVLKDLTARLQQALAAGLPPELMKAPKGGHTPVSWAKALLQALDVPRTTENMAAIIAWEMAEGGHWYNTAHYNPLNTTWRMPGATAMNSVGVKAYLSWAQGLAATVNTFHNGLYEGILAALRAGNDAQAVADAVAASPWGTGSFAVRF